MRNKMPLDQLAKYLSTQPYQLFMGLGFDQRCLAVLRASTLHKPQRVIALTNVGWSYANTANALAFNALVDTNKIPSVAVENDSGGILRLADQLLAFFEQSANDGFLNVIDVTSMSHELLAVLIAILHHKGLLTKCEILYNGAAKYSTNTSESDMWLSKGVSEVRSVLGYPGIQLSSTKLHLTLTIGFEVERALETISRYEPAAISIGTGKLTESISPELHYLNIAHRKMLLDALSSKGFSDENIFHFEFSCTDPISTKLSLKNHLARFSSYNNVICPLNTKLSTIGAALYCLEEQSTQLCYAQPIDYNFAGYSEPSEYVTIFRFD